MRVLLVTDQYSAEGGAEAIAAGLARGLDERGHDVRLCVARAALDAPALPERVGCSVVAWSGEGQPADPAAAELAVDQAVTFAPDVIHFHNIFDWGVVESLQQRWPTVWTVHDHRAHCPNGDRRYPRTGGLCHLPMGAACIAKSLTHGCVAGPRLRTVRQLRLRERAFAALRAADRIIVPSRCVADLLAVNHVPPERIVHVSPFTPYADAPLPPPYPNDGGVLFVGRLVPQKGVEDVLWLASSIGPEGVRLVIAGDGPMRPQVQAAAAHSPTLDYRGKLDAAALSAAYAEASVVVVTPRWIDPSPLVGIEALAHARPVVSYRTGGMAELIEDGQTGYAVEGADREALVAAVRRVLATRVRAAEMGLRGWQLVRARNRPRRAFEATEQAYEESMRVRGTAACVADCPLDVFLASADPQGWQAALEVRIAVFVREQDVPLDAEVDRHDLHDASCIHTIARGPGGRPVGTGRVYEELPGVARIGRMAVLPAYRSRGIGMGILEALLVEARRLQAREVVLDSQVHALRFYGSRGFQQEGPVFDDCGIPHQRMRLRLSGL